MTKMVQKRYTVHLRAYNVFLPLLHGSNLVHRQKKTLESPSPLNKACVKFITSYYTSTFTENNLLSPPRVKQRKHVVKQQLTQMSLHILIIFTEHKHNPLLSSL